jgi:hypothetical protein
MSDTSHSHNYGTRIRNNSILKPSARLRQSPQPRRIKPVPQTSPHDSTQNQPQFPIFPLPNVMLHPEDATSKVFHAIGRCFLSVVSPFLLVPIPTFTRVSLGQSCHDDQGPCGNDSKFRPRVSEVCSPFFSLFTLLTITLVCLLRRKQ